MWNFEHETIEEDRSGQKANNVSESDIIIESSCMSKDYHRCLVQPSVWVTFGIMSIESTIPILSFDNII